MICETCEIVWERTDDRGHYPAGGDYYIAFSGSEFYLVRFYEQSDQKSEDHRSGTTYPEGMSGIHVTRFFRIDPRYDHGDPEDKDYDAHYFCYCFVVKC